MEPTVENFRTMIYMGFSFDEMLKLILIGLGIVILCGFIYLKVKNKK